MNCAFITSELPNGSYYKGYGLSSGNRYTISNVTIGFSSDKVAITELTSNGIFSTFFRPFTAYYWD